MHEEFLAIDKEKQEKIINVGLWEFAKHEYDRASTNHIVEEAGISKGILFHYFKSKLGFYEFLLNYSIDTLKPLIMNTVDYTEPDLFVRLKQVSKVKLQLIKRYPAMSEFLQKAMTEPPKALAKKIEQLYNDSYKESIKLYSDFDTGKFKEGIPIDKVFDIIYFTMLGYYNKVTAEYKNPEYPIDFEEMFRKADEYLNILRQAFYK